MDKEVYGSLGFLGLLPILTITKNAGSLFFIACGFYGLIGFISVFILYMKKA